MENKPIVDVQDDFVVFQFHGDFFDGPMPSIIFERQLSALRRYALEIGFKEEEVLIKIEEGSKKIITLLNIVTPIVFLLSVDYGQVERNINSLSNKAKEVVKELLEPFAGKEGMYLRIYEESDPNKKIATIKNGEASNIIRALGLDNEEKEVSGVVGVIKNIDVGSKMVLRTSEYGDINLSFNEKSIKSIKDIASLSVEQSFDTVLAVSGTARVNTRGDVTSVKVSEYEIVKGSKNLFVADADGSM